jgi:hypothetical protein
VLGTVLVMVSISCLDPAETFLLNICFASLSGIWFWGPLLVFFLFIYFRSRNHSATLRMNSITPSKANEQMRSVKDEARADKKKTIERRKKKTALRPTAPSLQSAFLHLLRLPPLPPFQSYCFRPFSMSLPVHPTPPPSSAAKLA